MARVNIPWLELNKLLDTKIANKTNEVRGLEPNKSNPTARDNYVRAKAELETLIAVRGLLHGNRVDFNVL